MRIEVDLENVNFKVITNEGAKCGFCNKKLKPVGLSYLYANVNHDMVEYERCDCSEAIAFWKNPQIKNKKIQYRKFQKRVLLGKRLRNPQAYVEDISKEFDKVRRSFSKFRERKAKKWE